MRRHLTVGRRDAWLRVKGLRDAGSGARAAGARAGGLARARAIERNRPRGWILDDAALREIVLQVPRTADALAQIAGHAARPGRGSGEELLECVAAAQMPQIRRHRCRRGRAPIRPQRRW